jgi:hypothetical protein
VDWLVLRLDLSLGVMRLSVHLKFFSIIFLNTTSSMLSSNFKERMCFVLNSFSITAVTHTIYGMVHKYHT